jgi:two-component system, LuxR family, sensor kinase FixL
MQTPVPKPRLLVADDEEGLLFLMIDALRREGWDVEGFGSGRESLDWLENHTPDLLLLDLRLADISALDLVERLRATGREFPFIIVTGHGDERTAVEAMKYGALDYVMKDAGMLELLPGIVRRALGILERERRLTEAKETVRQGQELHKQIIQTALDGFVRFDLHGKVLEANQALCDLLGESNADIVGADVFNSKETALFGNARGHVEAMEADDAARCFTRLVRRDGTEIEVELSFRKRGGEIFGFVHDISVQRHLERKMQQITLDERRRFGQELHDGLGQQLTAVEMMTHTLARELKTTSPKQAKAAFDIANYVRRAVTQTREIAHGLVPVSEEGEGLMNALQELARMTSLAGIECDFQCPKPVKVEDAGTASHLHRIAQEGVTNALKHARAKHIRLRLEDLGSEIELTIEDDGTGFSRRKKADGGMGLNVMQHRAVLIGGRLVVEAAAGQKLTAKHAPPRRPLRRSHLANSRESGSFWWTITP